MPSKEHYKQAYEALEKLNVYHLKDKFIGELSGGEIRLVYLARIFVRNFNILLLDKPNTFLDYINQNDFFN